MAQWLRNWKMVILVVVLTMAAEGIARIAAVQRLFDPVDGSVEAARWRYVYLQAEPDIVLMGDSRAVLDLSPNAIRAEMARLTGREPSVVNVAIHGSSMEQSALFFSEVLLRTAKPRLVVLNVSEVALNDAAWQTHSPAYLRGLAAPLARKTWQTASSRRAVWESVSGLARLQHRLKLAIEGPWIRYWRGAERYDWGAMKWHGQMGAQAQAEELAIYRNTYLADFQPTGAQMRYLASLVRMAHDHDVRLILLLTPVQPEFLDAFPAPGDVIRFQEAVYDVADQYDIPLIDYYHLPDLTSDMFFDLHHTNAKGTQRFSALVAQDIVDLALVHWNEPQVASSSIPEDTGRSSP